MANEIKIYIGAEDSDEMREMASVAKKKGWIVGTTPSTVSHYIDEEIRKTEQQHGLVIAGGALSMGGCVRELAVSYLRKGIPVTIPLSDCRIDNHDKGNDPNDHEVEERLQAFLLDGNDRFLSSSSLLTILRGSLLKS